jgi:hypothetical protein
MKDSFDNKNPGFTRLNNSTTTTKHTIYISADYAIIRSYN